MPRTRFDQIGAPFPLFKGAIASTSDAKLDGVCTFCQRAGLVFKGDDIIVECEYCDGKVGLSARNHEDTTCPHCGEFVPFAFDVQGAAYACYDCLRAGRLTLTKSTALGLVTWREALEGATASYPNLNHPDFEIIAGPLEPVIEGTEPVQWNRAKVDPKWLWELLATPTYDTWQGEHWLFHCRRPMEFLGEVAPDEPELLKIAFPDVDLNTQIDVVNATLSVFCIYILRCPECGAIEKHEDCT